jgi:hypothetical protein
LGTDRLLESAYNFASFTKSSSNRTLVAILHPHINATLCRSSRLLSASLVAHSLAVNTPIPARRRRYHQSQIPGMEDYSAPSGPTPAGAMDRTVVSSRPTAAPTNHPAHFFSPRKNPHSAGSFGLAGDEVPYSTAPPSSPSFLVGMYITWRPVSGWNSSRSPCFTRSCRSLLAVAVATL